MSWSAGGIAGFRRARGGGAAGRDPGAEPRALAVVARALPLQAAFNPVTLQGAGFAFAVLPWLERVHGPAAAARAAQLAGGFNANPYLAPLAIGAVAAAEGRESTGRVDRFLALVRGPLGSVGDSLFWGAARPAIFVIAALAVCAGAPWWAAFLALPAFNTLAFAARLASARAGLAHGVQAGRWLAGSWIRRAPAPVRAAGAAGAGVIAGLMLGRALLLAAQRDGGGLARGAEAMWLPALAFGLAVALFLFWPRRFGWGLAPLLVWALLAALGAATLG